MSRQSKYGSIFWLKSSMEGILCHNFIMQWQLTIHLLHCLWCSDIHHFLTFVELELQWNVCTAAFWFQMLSWSGTMNDWCWIILLWSVPTSHIAKGANTKILVFLRSGVTAFDQDSSQLNGIRNDFWYHWVGQQHLNRNVNPTWLGLFCFFALQIGHTTFLLDDRVNHEKNIYPHKTWNAENT